MNHNANGKAWLAACATVALTKRPYNSGSGTDKQYRWRLTCWTTAAAATASIIITANPGRAVSPIIASRSQRRSVSACGRRGVSAAGDRIASLASDVVERAKPTSASQRQITPAGATCAAHGDCYCCRRPTARSPAAGSARAGFPGRSDGIERAAAHDDEQQATRRGVHWARATLKQQDHTGSHAHLGHAWLAALPTNKHTVLF